MPDETAAGSAGAPQGRGHPQGGPGEQSPLQARAQFLKNRGWESVASFNRAACSRGGAQHGANPETQAACRAEWQQAQQTVLSLDDTLNFLLRCHRRAPFLFFNGNTFADIGRQIAAALFAELPPPRLREVTSAIAHYIAGVLDHDTMVAVVHELCVAADFHPGDRVKTMRGSTRGVILRVLADGRVVWRPEGSASQLTALPESLLRLDPPAG